MRGFAGFPDGRLAFALIPDLFFSEALPLIDDLAELKVTLHILWLTHRKRGQPEWISTRELETDGVLLGSLRACGADPKEALGEGLRRAVERGTLLCVVGTGPAGQSQSWYLVNSPRGRRVLRRLQCGDLSLPEGEFLEQRPVPQKPNIFVLYEQNIGPLQPIIAEELEEAQRLYPSPWLEEAFRIAAERNARSWRYVRAILERWRTRGKDELDHSEERDRRRYISGEYEEYSKL